MIFFLILCNFCYSDILADSNFILKQREYFPDYNNITASLYEHKKHKCPFLHIETNDTLNFFSVTFRTTSSDESGVSHVLEHLTLQGSQHYPIKSIFSELYKRSYANFMNAFTSNQWTAYPFSSTNEKDFHNNLKVYLDAVFYPLLNPIDFLSECHHLEFKDPGNTSSSLKHSGVVYNEMLGVYSDPYSYLDLRRMKLLFPDSILGLSFGGNPNEITNLTLEQIKKQHQKYYHPYNALFYHYGSFNTTKVMNEIDKIINPMKEISEENLEEINKVYEKIKQPKWESPKSIIEKGPTVKGQNSEKVRVIVSWFIGDALNASAVADLLTLSNFLFSMKSSPLYQSLIKSGIGTQFFGNGFDDSSSLKNFAIGVEGVDKSNATIVNQTILSVLQDIYEKGFDPDEVKSTFHQYEMNIKQPTAYNGMHIWTSIIGPWVNNESIFDYIYPPWEIERMKNALEVNPRYFEMILKHNLIDNPHRLDMIVTSDSNFHEKEKNNTKENLERIKNAMSQEELNEIVLQADNIQKSIDQEKPVNLLPKFSKNDLNPNITDNLIIKTTNKYNRMIVSYPQPTNDLIYINFKCELPNDSQYIYLANILSDVLYYVGADNLSSDELNRETSIYSSGISISTFVHSQDDPDIYKTYICFSGSALSHDIEKFIELLGKVIKKPTFDNLTDLSLAFSSSFSSSYDSLSSDGISYSHSYAAAGLSKSTTLEEILHGITYLRNKMRIASDTNLSRVSELLSAAYKEMIIDNGHFVASIHCQEHHLNKTCELVQSLLDTLPSHINETQTNYSIDWSHTTGSKLVDNYQQTLLNHNNSLIYADTNTYFSSVCYKGTTFNDPESPYYTLASLILKNDFLHNVIREKLGAYGAISSYSPFSGVIHFGSYRDTNPLLTLNAINNSLHEVSQGNITNEMVDNAIIKVFSSLDKPISPQNKGNDHFLNALSNEILQRRRNIYFKANSTDIIHTVKKMIKKGEMRYAVVGSEIDAESFSNLSIINIFNLKTDSDLDFYYPSLSPSDLETSTEA